MAERNVVYLAWQAAETREWNVVGALKEAENGYEFNYTKGALSARNFTPFSGMDDLGKSYFSVDLFPLFRNRLLSRKRPEYPRFIKWLGLRESEATPVNILALSGGLRGTDNLQMFRRLEVRQNGCFEHFFFLHGLGHLARSAQKRVDSLSKGERLYLCRDCQNEYDNDALIVRADEPSEIVGFCPRYLVKDVNFLLGSSEFLHVEVEKITLDAPVNYRLMCRIEGRLKPSDLCDLPDHEEYRVIAEQKE